MVSIGVPSVTKRRRLLAFRQPGTDDRQRSQVEFTSRARSPVEQVRHEHRDIVKVQARHAVHVGAGAI